MKYAQHAARNPKLEKNVIIQTSPVVAVKTYVANEDKNTSLV